ncbi:NADH dehydrogenase [Methanophagales archaeon]|nr:NADH dehydrogenase [Methanophagales archaeon]
MKIVVLGCGFGGVEVARELRKRSKELDIIMIDRRARLEYLAVHPEILSAKVTPEEISGDLNKFASEIGAKFIQDTVVDLDFKAKKVKAGGNGHEIAYDFLVIAIGAEQTFFGIQGAEALSCSVNTLNGALETKNALDQLDYVKKANIAVIGGGLTGVEVAGELNDYFDDRGAQAKIYLVEMMPRVLPAFPKEKVSKYVAKILADRGVEILTETAVQEVGEEAITFTDGSKRPYDLVIWTAGIKPNSLLEKLDIPKVKGWLKADSYLRVSECVFAVGDTLSYECAGVRSGQNVEEAERQGRVAAANIIRTIKGVGLVRYRPKNTIQNPRAFLSLGSDKAVMYFNGLVLTVFAYRLKKFVEHRYMKRFHVCSVKSTKCKGI